MPDRFERTCEYFEQSLKAAQTLENTFAYAYFLQEHNQFIAATPWYEEALRIRRRLAEANPQTYLPYVATTLNNLANLQQATNEFPAALEAYEEALRIYRRLTEANPQTYLPYVATTLNNLAILQADKNEFPAALEAYEEALRIYRRLTEANPQTYLPDVAMTAMNLSIFYLHALPGRERSLAYAREALAAALPFVETLPTAQNYARTTLQVVEAWGVDTKMFIEETVQSLQGSAG
jgi:tetratricopeptide (TPR) repeat protein